MSGYPPPHALKHRLTVAEAEAEMEARAGEYQATVSPHWLKRWETFKAGIEADDQLWYFEDFPEPLTGGAGYCILREGRPVAWITTMRA
ncbi:MAG TPA: hypothetical protein VFS20_24350 [Longimicrobium sp.]|nr:hypothetical protein [Longimicrobium sp.]